MRKLNRSFVVALTMLVLTAVAQADDEQDEKVPLDKVPAKVMEALKAKYPKATVVSAEKGDVDGTKVYEFALEQGKKKWEACFTPDGKFFSSEEAVTKLPAKVQEAFDTKYPGAKVTKIDKETTGEGDKAKVVYEIFIERGTDTFEIQYDASGKYLAEKKLAPPKKK
jgi:hypothetical protein